jgi:carboxymethylenebutenolidase
VVILSRATEDIPCGDRTLRAYVVRPQEARAPLPPVIAWSDIFQLTPPHLRLIDRIASYGFLVVAPEIYSKLEPAGTVLDFDRDRQRALDDASKLDPAWIDEERRAVIDHVLAKKDVDRDRLAVCGWCFGGNLAFRAAREPEVKAAACFYGTTLPTILDRAKEIRGALSLVWGTNDPHIPDEARRTIHRALADAGVRFQVRLFDAEHAFMRDVGPRWDPEATDAAFAAMIDLFERECR